MKSQLHHANFWIYFLSNGISLKKSKPRCDNQVYILEKSSDRNIKDMKRREGEDQLEL